MEQAILDTNFIMTCVKQKIDFFEELENLGIKILIPEQVIKELEKNKAALSLTLLTKEKNSFKKIDIGKGHVDKKIIKYARENPKIIVATLDKEIQKKVSNKRLIIRQRKKLEFQ